MNHIKSGTPLVAYFALIICVPQTVMCHASESTAAPDVVSASKPVSEQGLALWLRSDAGIVARDGRVEQWQDCSPRKRIAKVPTGMKGPMLAAVGNALVFTPETALYIDEPVLPADTRELTVMAVARAEEVSSVAMFAIRNRQNPLLQLDVEDNGNVRFIVRDDTAKTLIATTPCVFSTPAIFGGVLSKRDNGESVAQVLFGAGRERGAPRTLTAPFLTQGAWIGGLKLPSVPPYSWRGTISEILVYDRALTESALQDVQDYLRIKYELQPPQRARKDSWDVLSTSHPAQPVTQEVETDVCVVGGGSGGTGAAIAAAREGVRVVLVERQSRLGGTGVNAFVSVWEPGPGCSIAKELYERMHAVRGAGVAVANPVHSTAPMAYNLVKEDEPYESTLVRATVPPSEHRCVPYLPETFDQVARAMLAETGKVTVCDRTIFFQAETNAERTRIESILVRDMAGRILRIRARIFLDCSGCVWLCRSLGCDTMLGVDPRSRFQEPSAPEEGFLELNAISRCYSIRPRTRPVRDAPPPINVPFPRCAFVTGWKDGLQTVNPMPMLPGRALIDYGYDECLMRSEAIARAHWRWLQEVPEFRGYELAEIAPMLGIRESYRVVARYVLTEHDLKAGLAGQPHDDIIAVADHPCDIHGAGGGLAAVRTAYGIPYRCLIPASSYTNLLVACRGAGFSKIAASSCRLQRTIIQLGHAAGMAAAMAINDKLPVEQIDVPQLVRRIDAKSRYPAVGAR